MPARPDHPGMNHDACLAKALRALPDAPPPADGWAKLAARSRRRRSVRRAAWLALPAACAAAIACFIVLPQAPNTSLARSQAVAASTTPRKPAPQSINALQASSTQWQAWVQQLAANGAPLNGRALADAVTLQDRIGLIDLQLSGTRDAARAADLWRQRITLLQQLGLLHLQPQLVASQAHDAHPGAISL